MHARQAQAELLVLVEDALAHEADHSGDLQGVGELHDVLAGMAPQDAAATVDDGLLGVEQGAHRLLHLLVVALVGGLVAGELDLFGVVVLDGLAQQVAGHVDDHGARAAGAGDVVGLCHDAGDVLGLADEVAVLDDGQGDARDVAFLEGVASQGAQGHLAADDHHGDGVHVGGGNAGDGVGGTGAGGDDDRASLAGCAGIAVCGMGRALLVAHQDVVQLLAVIQRIVDEDGLAAGIAEDSIDAGVLECGDEGAVALHHLSVVLAH